MNIGERIKQERISQNLSQKELGDRMGVKHNQVSRIESGKFNAESLNKTLMALGVTLCMKRIR